MATITKKTTNKKTPTKKTVSKTTSSNTKRTSVKDEKKTINKQAIAIVMFFLGILLMLFVFIKGEAGWTAIHNGLFAFFGLSAYLVAPIIIYASVMIALEKKRTTVLTKVLEGIVLILLFSALSQIIFSSNVFDGTFTENVTTLANEGKSLEGGGLVSILIGIPLFVIFGKTGSLIITIILVLIFFILLANISLMQIFKFFTTPFVKNIDADDENEANSKKLEKNNKNAKKNEKRVDFAKFVQDDKKPEDINVREVEKEIDEEAKKYDEDIKTGKLTKNNVKADTSPIENEQDILPSHPVVAPKITQEKLEAAAETAKNNDDPQLQDIIIKAVAVKAEKDREKAQNKSNSIYVEPDGQTSLYEKDNTVSIYKNPPINILKEGSGTNINENTQNELKHNSEVLVDTLKSFGVQTRIVDICRGPAVTRYELQPAAGVKVSKITALTDDIKMSLAARSIRIEAPIPGKAAVGVEIPNKEVDVITMREILESKEFKSAKSTISFALGKDITGTPIIADIAKMPHVLIAGATGSGKSVCINSILISLLYRSSPDDVRLLMVDPKMVELEVYNGIPHLLIPVVTDPRKAAGALSWAVTEMQKRYKLFADNSVRNLTGYNELAKNTEGMEPLPQIVIIIDELADLMMVAAKDVEEAICRLAQLARAAGMHLVIATQRPSVDVITGIIKANIPSRIAFAVSSQIDSRTILDSAGAEKLLGRGDMLFSAYGAPVPTRVQGCFVSDKEVENVVAFVKNEIKADYDEEIMEEIEKNAPVAKGEGHSSGGGFDEKDEMLDQAIETVIDSQQASTSFLQRRLKLGYARAARIMDEMYEMGVVGEQDGAKPRKILMTKEQWLEMKVTGANSDDAPF